MKIKSITTGNVWMWGLIFLITFELVPVSIGIVAFVLSLFLLEEKYWEIKLWKFR